MATGRQVVDRSLKVEPLGGAGFTPDGRCFIDMSANIWHDMKSGGERKLFDKGNFVGGKLAFSADSRLVARVDRSPLAGLAKGLCIFEVQTARELGQVEAPLGFAQPLALSPDGRLVAASGPDAIHVWEVSSGKRLLHQTGKGDLTYWSPEGFAVCMAFSPDGKTLATGHANGTILLWDLTGAWKSLSVPDGLMDAVASWDALADADCKKAYSAIDRLAAYPAKAVALLRENVVAAEAVNAQWLADRLAELDSDKFVVRAAAQRQLQKVVDRVETPLRQTLEKPPSAEVRNRVEAILKTLQNGRSAPIDSEGLRQLRAITVLERIGSHEAQGLLREWSSGSPDARLTQEAEAALQRLGSR